MQFYGTRSTHSWRSPGSANACSHTRLFRACTCVEHALNSRLKSVSCERTPVPRHHGRRRTVVNPAIFSANCDDPHQDIFLAAVLEGTSVIVSIGGMWPRAVDLKSSDITINDNEFVDPLCINHASLRGQRLLQWRAVAKFFEWSFNLGALLVLKLSKKKVRSSSRCPSACARKHSWIRRHAFCYFDALPHGSFRSQGARRWSGREFHCRVHHARSVLRCTFAVGRVLRTCSVVHWCCAFGAGHHINSTVYFLGVCTWCSSSAFLLSSACS